VRQRGPEARPDGSRLPDAVAEQVADAMFALATPSRVQILRVLMGGPRTAGDLTEMLGMEQSAVSHQLRILREHALIRVERVGRQRVYALHDDQVGASGAASTNAAAPTPGGQTPSSSVDQPQPWDPRPCT
jgi:DNA-binding transcriptional ArsR family regulator